MSWLPLAMAFVMFAQGAALAPSPLSAGIAWRGVAVRLALPAAALLVTMLLGLPQPVAVGLLLAALAPPAVGALALGGLVGAHVVALGGLVLVGTALMVPVLAISGFGAGLMATLLWVALPFMLGFALRTMLARWERALSMTASAVSGAMIVVTLWLAWGDPSAAPDLAAMAAILVTLAGAAAAGLLGATLSLAERQALVLSALIPVPAVPIGLSALAIGADFGPAALPAALFAITGYAIAILLIILRLRTGR